MENLPPIHCPVRIELPDRKNKLTMKQEFSANFLSPLPIALIGALVDGHPNFLVIGYSAPFNFGKHLFFSIYKKRYTLKGILEHKAFSVNIPHTGMAEVTDYCGIVSGKNRDKSKLFEFEILLILVKTLPVISLTTTL